MTNYYRIRQEAFEEIKKIIKNSGESGINTAFLEKHLLERYGFSKRVLNEFLRVLDNTDNIIIINNNVVRWKE